MHDIMRLDVKENIHDENDHIAEHVKQHLSEDGILVVNVMGAPGVGKTTTLKNIFKNLKTAKPYVIEGDIESDIIESSDTCGGDAVFFGEHFSVCAIAHFIYLEE